MYIFAQHEEVFLNFEEKKIISSSKINVRRGHMTMYIEKHLFNCIDGFTIRSCNANTYESNISS